MPKSRIRRYIRHGMLPQLAVFEAVCRLGSYTRAAEELFIAQPTVSTQMKKLADTLGIAHYRSFCAQLGHWVTDGILSRTGRGLYTLQPEWRSPQTPAPPAKIADLPDPSTA